MKRLLLGLILPITVWASDEKEWANSVDLLKTANPIKDSIAGKWELRDGKLSSMGDISVDHKMQFSYHTPKEYDYRVDFVAKDVNGVVFVVFSHYGFTCSVMAGRGVVGFRFIGGKEVKFQTPLLDNRGRYRGGSRHSIIIRVRTFGYELIADDMAMGIVKGDSSTLSVHGVWDIPDHRAVGLDAKGPFSFEKVLVNEVTGKGYKKVRK